MRQDGGPDMARNSAVLCAARGVFHDALPPYRTSSLLVWAPPVCAQAPLALSLLVELRGCLFASPRQPTPIVHAGPLHSGGRGCVAGATAISSPATNALCRALPTASPQTALHLVAAARISKSASHRGETHLSRRARVARHMGHLQRSHCSDCTRLLQLRICLQREMCIYIPMMPYKAATRFSRVHTLPCSPLCSPTCCAGAIVSAPSRCLFTGRPTDTLALSTFPLPAVPSSASMKTPQ